jgi:hypothetical protein
MEQFDGDISSIGNSSCSQSLTFDFLEQLSDIPTDELQQLMHSSNVIQINGRMELI